MKIEALYQMGGCLSCSCRCTSPNTLFNTVRLVHLNGYVEDFDHPISVSELIGKPPKQFLCTAPQLLFQGCSKPLNPDTQLEPGHLYFVLPLSTLHEHISPLDMASLVKRLTARAKSIRSHHLSPNTSPSSTQNSLGSGRRSPGRAKRREITTYGLQKSWKPILDAIKEISFSSRSESDLQDMHFVSTT